SPWRAGKSAWLGRDRGEVRRSGLDCPVAPGVAGGYRLGAQPARGRRPRPARAPRPSRRSGRDSLRLTRLETASAADSGRLTSDDRILTFAGYVPAVRTTLKVSGAERRQPLVLPGLAAAALAPSRTSQANLAGGGISGLMSGSAGAYPAFRPMIQ